MNHTAESECAGRAARCESGTGWPEPRQTCEGCPRAPYSPGELECDICIIGCAAPIWELFVGDETVKKAADYEGINLVELMIHPLSRLLLQAARDRRRALP